MKFNIILMGALMLLVLNNTASASFEKKITLKEKAEISSNEICLQDIVQDVWVKQRCSFESKKCCMWNIPSGSHKAFLEKKEIQKLLGGFQLAGFELLLEGPSEIQIEQTSRFLSKEEVKDKIVLYLAEKFGVEDRKNINIKKLNIRQPVPVLLSNESDWGVVMTDKLSSRPTFKVIASAKNESQNDQALGWVDTQVALLGEVFVSKINIKPFSSLQREDFELRKTDLLSDQGLELTGENKKEYVGKDQFPIGVRSKLSIRAGEKLSMKSIEKIPLVKLGDSVTIILRSDNLKVSTKGVVQGAAALGDMVTVQTNRSNRTFRGKLIEGKFVEVWL